MNRTGENTARAAPDLSLVLVSWNVWDHVRACLDELEAHSRSADGSDVRELPSAQAGQPALTFEVVLVDAASSDATPDLIPRRFPWVRFLPQQDNTGFSRGNNIGWRAARGSTVFLVNPDTLVNPAALRELHRALWSRPDVGLVGPRLVRSNGELQPSRRRFPQRLTGFWESTWLGRAWPENPWARRYHCRQWPDDFRQEVDWLEGAALMVRRDVLAGVGGFDERLFMYSEETDLCLRIREAGWRIQYCPEADIIHHGGVSSDQVPAQTHIIFNTSKVLYYRKHFGVLWSELLRRFLLCEFALQLGLEFAKLLVGHRVALRRDRIHSYRRVLGTGLHSTG